MLGNAFDSRRSITETRISELQDITVENTKTEKQRKKWKNKSEHNIQNLWDNYKRYNICIMGIPEEKRERNRSNIGSRKDCKFSLK